MPHDDWRWTCSNIVCTSVLAVSKYNDVRTCIFESVGRPMTSFQKPLSVHKPSCRRSVQSSETDSLLCSLLARRTNSSRCNLSYSEHSTTVPFRTQNGNESQDNSDSALVAQWSCAIQISLIVVVLLSLITMPAALCWWAKNNNSLRTRWDRWTGCRQEVRKVRRNLHGIYTFLPIAV